MPTATRTVGRFIAVIAATTVAALPSTGAAAPVPVYPTVVTTFQPAVPKGSRRSGECWTNSIAVARPGAWRCSVDNEIHDPCFSRADSSRAVICGANPANNSTGFVLDLTKPLPKRSTGRPTHPRPWLVQLADGSFCEIQTGTIASVGGLDVPYGCSDSRPCDERGCPYMTGLTTRFQRGTVWKADKVTYASAAKRLELLRRTRVVVTAVWN